MLFIKQTRVHSSNSPCEPKKIEGKEIIRPTDGVERIDWPSRRAAGEDVTQQWM